MPRESAEAESVVAPMTATRRSGNLSDVRRKEVLMAQDSRAQVGDLIVAERGGIDREIRCFPVKGLALEQERSYRRETILGLQQRPVGTSRQPLQ